MYSAGENPENMQYCMNSQHARNVKMMNEKMGYHNMSDKANHKSPSTMNGAKANMQDMDGGALSK